MNSADILAGNHDIHMHSRDFSDGSHSVIEVVCQTARWQRAPRWVGLSDHSPKNNDQVQHYLQKLYGMQQELLSQDSITLLAGIELEWNSTGPADSQLTLSGLDYVIASYHGRKFSTARGVEKYFELVMRHPFSDGAAHPDRFLGSVDPLSVGWEEIFKGFSRTNVLCEYNLTTPLHPQILEIAINRTDVNFVIGSDTHDFRNIGIRRVVDAWGEMLGGGFVLAREYLVSLLKLECSSAQIKTLYELFETNQLLDSLQRKLYLNSFNKKNRADHLSAGERKLLQTLESIPECALDKDFLLRRLDRFNTLPSERIISLLPVEDFKDAIRIGRQKRAE